MCDCVNDDKSRHSCKRDTAASDLCLGYRIEISFNAMVRMKAAHQHLQLGLRMRSCMQSCMHACQLMHVNYLCVNGAIIVYKLCQTVQSVSLPYQRH